MIEGLKKSLIAHLNVTARQKEFYDNNLLNAMDNEDKVLANLYRQEIRFYEGRKDIIDIILEEIKKLEQKEQEEFELALSEAPFGYERPIEVQI